MSSPTPGTHSPARPSMSERLLAEFVGLPGVVVAFSGGADSALVLAAATRALGVSRVRAITAVSGSLPEVERAAALAYARSLGVAHQLVETSEMERSGYRANAGDRCYFCKSELMAVVSPIAAGLGWPIATGTNADDMVAGFRPGIRAAAESNALTPLANASLSKDDVRSLSRDWNLPTWDKPAAACLSSRIAYGLQITPQRLRRVEDAESAVRRTFARVQRPLRDLRVRDLGAGQARIELDADAVAALTPKELASIIATVRRSGFERATVAQFRSGSMNDALISGSEAVPDHDGGPSAEQ